MVFLSIVVPALNEQEYIGHTLERLQHLRALGVELILSDGGSSDRTVDIASPLLDHCCEGAAGRALQMNAGAGVANGEWLLFLHADTQLPKGVLKCLQQADHQGAEWGFFPVRLSGAHSLLRVVEIGMNWRSRLTSVATGDQAIFVRRTLWESLQGFAAIPLMEDIDFSKRARQLSSPFVASSLLVTSSRRWESRGVLKTVVLMWWLRLQYWLGVSAETLKHHYD